MKYNHKDIREQRISFRDLTREQFNKLKAHFMEKYPGDNWGCGYGKKGYYHRFYKVKDSKLGCNHNNYSYIDIILNYIRASKEITFDEFTFDDFVLPEKWCLKVSDNNIDIINEYRTSNKISSLISTQYYLRESGFTTTEERIKRSKTIVEITTEQFIKYVMKEDKTIIGYKLINEKYNRAASCICGVSELISFDKQGCCFETGTPSHKAIKEAGVLDLWFEPVYEKEKPQVINMDGFNLTIKDKKVYHKTEDITDFVKGMYKIWSFDKVSKKIEGYDCIVFDIIFSKTGCEKTETKLSDWLKVYDLIK